MNEREHLTNNSHTEYPRIRGFMDNGQNEQQPKPVGTSVSSPENLTQQIPTLDAQKVRRVNPRVAENFAARRALTEGDRLLMKHGLVPIAGGAPRLQLSPLDETKYSGPLQDIAKEANLLADTTPEDAEGIKELQKRARQAFVGGAAVDRAKAIEIIEGLEGWVKVVDTKKQTEAKSARAGMEHEQQQREDERSGITSQARALIEAYKASADPAEKGYFAEQLAKIVSVGNPLSSEVIEDVIVDSARLNHDKALEYLVTTILSAPLEAETSQYHLEFYPGNNLGALLAAVRKAVAQANNPDTKLHLEGVASRVAIMQAAIQFTHEMNREIITGNLERFIDYARGITPGQLQTLQEIPGVALAMRLYEEEFQQILSQKGYIDDAAYEKILGKIIDKQTIEIDAYAEDEDGKPIRKKETRDNIIRGKGTVETYFREIVGKGLEEWQIRLALNLGKNMYNDTLRAAEQISLGSLSGFKSAPQEHAARLMNWIGWLGKRFGVAEARGGQKFIDMTVAAYQHARHEQGYGETVITKLSNVDIKAFEYAGMFGVSGVWSGWRQENIILNNAPIQVGDDKTSISRYIGKYWQDQIEAYHLGERGQAKNVLIREHPDVLEKLYLRSGELRDEYTNALGVMLKLGDVTPSETDAPQVRAVKEKIRAAIWRKVAEDNPLAMTPLLTGLEVNEKCHKKDQLSILTEELKGESQPGVWDSLHRKLIVAHHERLLRIQKGEVGERVSLDGVLQELALEDSRKPEGERRNIALTHEESEMLGRIRGLGKHLSEDLTNIRFPFTPFLNDVIFEKVQYGDAGAAFYSRRVGGDLPSFHAAYGEFGKIIDNPGGISPEKALEAMLAIVQALGSPQGTNVGQDKVAPMLEAYIEFIKDGSNIEGDGLWAKVKRQLQSQSLVNAIKHEFHKPTSLAQEVAGMGAPAEKEHDTLNLLQRALHMGVLRKVLRDKDGNIIFTDLYDKFRKKFRVTFGGIIWALLRDYLVFLPIGIAKELVVSVQKPAR